MSLFGGTDPLNPTEPWTFQSNDRTLGLGKTGSGKTTGMKALILRNLDRFIFYDDKREEHRALDLPTLRTPDEVHEALFCENPEERLQTFCYVPQRPGDPEEFDEICRLVYEKRNHHLYVDELMGIYTDTSGVTQYHGKIMTEGRGKGVGITQNSQRPRHIPLRCFSESDHILCWYLKHSDDRDHVSGLIDATPEQIGGLKDYRFIYDHDGLRSATVCDKVTIP